MNEVCNFIKEIGYPAFTFVVMVVLYFQAIKERRTIIQNNTDAIKHLAYILSNRKDILQ
jgi:heme exporter protein D